MELSCDQINAKNKILDFLNNRSNNIFLLSGSAGTGKTTLIVNILSSEIFKKKSIVLSATTHKAVSVLKNIDIDNENIKYYTIHKLLNIKRRINKDGIEFFRSDGKTHNIENFDIIVIDECSMIEKDLLDKILEAASKIKGKIIFIGDICQLPPVNEKSSMVFNYNLEGYKLEQIMRYKGEIVNLCDNIRKLIFNKNTKLKLSNYKTKNIKIYRDLDKMTINFVKKLKKSENDYPIYICYTNKKCNYINNKIRKLLFGEDTNNKFIIGELIIFNNFYKTSKNKYYTSQKNIIKDINVIDYNIRGFRESILKKIDEKIEKYFNSLKLDEYEKNSVIIIKLKLLEKLENIFFKIEDLDIRLYKLKLNNLDYVYCLYDLDKEKYEKCLEKCKNSFRKTFTWLKTTIRILKDTKKLFITLIDDIWEIFYIKLIDVLCDIDYGYGITTHKSQASTFSNIYIDMENIIKLNKNVDESYRCLYTAITRTSNKLNILL